MSARIAINGFGRIGRLFFRQIIEDPSLEIAAINDLGDPENLAYLLKYDSVYGPLQERVVAGDGVLEVGARKIAVLREPDPAKLPWKKMGVAIAVEATGVFDSYQKARAHLEAGAKRIVITAPAKDEDTDDAKTVLMGVNDGDLGSCTLSSNGSCTTNAVAALIGALDERIGVAKAMLSTTHGYTASQSLVDSPARGHDVRRGRAAAVNIVPSSTGAAIAVARALSGLEGKFDGVALRVPVISGSAADITMVMQRKTSKEEVNEVLEKAASSERYQNVLDVTRDPIVSSDILGRPVGAIADLGFTRVVDGDLVKVLSWYDNEWGYVATLVRHVQSVVSLL